MKQNQPKMVSYIDASIGDLEFLWQDQDVWHAKCKNVGLSGDYLTFSKEKLIAPILL